MNRKQAIASWMEEHKPELLRDLNTLCSIRSVRGEPMPNAPYGEGPAAALKKALELCETYGLPVKNYDNYVGAADLCPEKPTELDVLAHLDVVNEGDGWTLPPFAATVRDDGCVYGRGVADDKGGVLAALYALRCVKELGVPLKYNCRLLMGTDEECGSSDIAYYYSKEKPAPHTTTPDANFPVCNVEKGQLRMDFRQTFAPTEALPRVSTFDGGCRFNVVPAEATALLLGIAPDDLGRALTPLCAEVGVTLRVAEEGPGAVRVTVTGTGCHAAMPELGNNGITALIRVLSALPLADCASTSALRAVNEVLPHGDYEGKALGIKQADEISGSLTCSFTQLNFDENGLWGICDMRVPVCANDDNCARVAQKTMRDAGFLPEGDMIPPHYTPADTPFVQKLLSAWEEYTGLPGTCYAMGGGTYVHNVPGGVAFGLEMPDFDTGMHGADERIRIADLITGACVYAQAIISICGEE